MLSGSLVFTSLFPERCWVLRFQTSQRLWERASDLPSALEVTWFLLPDRSGDFLLMGRS